MVLLLEALVVVGLVAGLTAVVFPVGIVVVRRRGRTTAAVIVVLGATLAFIDIDLTVFLVVGRRLVVALNPDITVFLNAPGSTSILLNVDVPVNVRRVGSVVGMSGSRNRSMGGSRRWRRSLLMNFNVDVRLLLLLLVFLGMLGLVGLFNGLESGQVAEDLAKTVVGNCEFLFSVLELFLLAEQPVNTVPHANTAAVLNVASDAFSMGRNVLEGAAHIAHAAVDPFGLFVVGLEDVVDFADREQTAHLLEIRADATDDAHVDGVGWTDITNPLGLCEEFGELVGASESGGSRAEGDELSFDHGEQQDRARKLPGWGGERSME